MTFNLCLPLPSSQAMLEDKLRHSDWDATYDAIEEAVARESYLSWLKENEKRTRSAGGVKHSASQVGICLPLLSNASYNW